jgi:hypothetical protein
MPGSFQPPRLCRPDLVPRSGLLQLLEDLLETSEHREKKAELSGSATADRSGSCPPFLSSPSPSRPHPRCRFAEDLPPPRRSRLRRLQSHPGHIMPTGLD